MKNYYLTLKIKASLFFLFIHIAKSNAEGFHYSQCAFALKHLEKAGLVRLEHFEDIYERQEDIPPEVLTAAEEHLQDFTILRLGKGNYGRVFRASTNNKHVDVKYYMDTEVDNVSEDLKAHKVLSSISDPSIVQIATVLDSGKRTITFKSTFGVPLSEYLANNDLPQSFRDLAQKKYNLTLRHLTDKLKDWSVTKGLTPVITPTTHKFKIRGVEYEQKMFRYLDPTTHEIFRFTLKPNNIIISPDGTLTIIDPY